MDTLHAAPADGKPPIPQAPDAEKGVLASMLLDPMPVFTRCAERNLDADQFYIRAHRILFETITGIIQRDQPVNFVTLTEALRAAGKLEHIGGTYAVNELFTYLTTAASAPHYIEIVQDKARRRQLIARCESTARRAYDGNEDLDKLQDEAQAAMADVARQAPKAAPLIRLMDISAGVHNPRATVLGNRFLCIGGAMLFVGPSGIGKSSASVQQDVLWALGRPAFGIRPARPLRILTIQAENDAEDLAEMRDGVIKGLRLTDEDREQVRENVFYETECGKTGAKFLDYVDRRLGLSQFDLLRIDHFTAYLGGDVSNPDHTTPFLREGLNQLLAKHRVACTLNHHTPKTTNRDTSGWRASDWMYAGAGASDVTNWARAALVIDPTHANHVFKFIAAKRGNRIGWSNDDGGPEIIRHFCHASDGLYWREAEPKDLEAVEAATGAKKTGRPLKTADDMKALVPMEGGIPKVSLLERARQNGFSKHAADATLAEMLMNGDLFASRHKRAGTNSEVRISRQQQTALEVKP